MDFAGTDAHAWIHRLIEVPGQHQPEFSCPVQQSHMDVLAALVSDIMEKALDHTTLTRHLQSSDCCRQYRSGMVELDVIRDGRVFRWTPRLLMLAIPLMAVEYERHTGNQKSCHAAAVKFNRLIKLGLLRTTNGTFEDLSQWAFIRVRNDWQKSEPYRSLFEEIGLNIRYGIKPPLIAEEATEPRGKRCRKDDEDIAVKEPHKSLPVIIPRFRQRSFAKRSALQLLKASVTHETCTPDWPFEPLP